MTDHIQQAATQQAQRDAQAELYEVQERLRLARRLNTVLGCFVLLLAGVAMTATTLALDDGPHPIAPPSLEKYELQWQLDDARQALDRCVNDLLEEPTPHTEWSPTLLNGIHPALTDRPTTLDPIRGGIVETGWTVEGPSPGITLSTLRGRGVPCEVRTDGSWVCGTVAK